ncbi:hypothetical protein BPAE_0101g00150 [Botrytis paeoniae]|uniref:Uncharacterized protein n=1 Tax=Botrytis paeoniae TaxID=278948 RepID=A0A4Z1FS14_9HELO|nr:hypothetical protein BPAE_0101g00150 [Botrytis paeoniae]
MFSSASTGSSGSSRHESPAHLLKCSLKTPSDTEQKALKEGVLHVIQNFEVPEDWYIVPMTFEKMKPSNYRPFADIIGDMVKTGSIRITDAADLAVEEVLDWEAKNQDTRANNACNVEENPCVAT